MKRLSDYEDERTSNWRIFAGVCYLVLLGLVGYSLAHIVRHGYMPFQDHFRPIQTITPAEILPGRYMLKTEYKGQKHLYMGTFQQVQDRKCYEYDNAIRQYSESEMLNRKNCKHEN